MSVVGTLARLNFYDVVKGEEDEEEEEEEEEEYNEIVIHDPKLINFLMV